MNISRKDFFRQGLFSIGKTALEVVGTLKGRGSDEAVMATAPSGDPRGDMVAAEFNDRCLARNCGCISCVESCQAQAIMLIPGRGIQIDIKRCIGCGTCEYICPVTPKAVILQSRI